MMIQCNPEKGGCGAVVEEGAMHMCGDSWTQAHGRAHWHTNDAFYYMGPTGLMKITDMEIEEMASNSATEYMMRGGSDPYHDAYKTMYADYEKAGKPVKKDYNTVAVKFINGNNLAKAYTYRVPKRAKLRLGQEVVVPTFRDGATTTTIAVVVEVHKTPQDTGSYDYKFVAGTVKPL